MPRQTPSTPKAANLPPRTLAKLHRAIAATRPLLEPLEHRTLLTTLAINPFSMTGTLSEADITTRYDFTLVRSDTDSFQTVGFAFAPLGDNPVDSADLTLLGDGVDNQLHTVTFAPGEIYASLHVAVIDDDLLEFDEQAQLQFFETESPAQVLASADLLVQSDDCRVWVSGGGTMSENAGTVDFIVHREDAYGLCPNAWAVAIRVKTAGQGDIRASADDYTVSLDNMDPGPGPDPTPLDVHNYYWVPFQANQSQSLVTVSAVNDSLPEPTEWLKLVLIGGTVAEASPPLSQTLPTQAYAAIEDDDNYLAPPNAPTNLSATPFSNTAITLNWQDNSTDETAFLLEKSTDGVNWSTVQVLEPDTTTATVDNLDPAIDYAFRLRAENPSASVPSDFTPPLPASTQWQNLGAPLAVPITTTGESPIWLNNGESLVAGEGYRLVYSSGGVNYSSQSPPNTWTAASYAVRSEDWNYMHWQTSPFPFVSSLSEVPSIANDLTWSFTSPGAPMALYFNAGDPQYFTGPGVTWQLQKQIPHVSVNLFNGNHTTEGDTTPLQVTLTRDAYFNEPLTVHYTLTPGTADANDITDQYSGTATIDANAFSVDIPILATDDSTPEWTENLQFQIASETGYFAAGDPANIHVKDNDISFTLDEEMLVANYDDDDNNGVTDYLDPTSSDIGNDDDLYQLTLNIPDGYAQNTSVTLTATSGFFNIYDSAAKDNLLSDTGTVSWNDPTAVPPSVWVEVKTGSTTINDVTIRLTSTDNGDDQISERDYTAVNVHIQSMSDPDEAGDVTNSRRNWLPGQMVDLQAYVEAPAEWLGNLSYEWTVPGLVAKDYQIVDVHNPWSTPAGAPTNNTATLTDLPDQDKEAALLSYFWIAADTQPVDSKEVSVRISGVNGQTLDASTYFALYSPQFFGGANFGIAREDTVRDNNNNPRRGIGLTVLIGSPGSSFTGSVTIPDSFAAGTWGFVQKIKPNDLWDDGQLKTEPHRNQWGLDTMFPYKSDFPTGGAIHTVSDTPFAYYDPGFNTISLDQEFNMYVMFKPPGGDSSRWVPIKGWYYSYNISATRNGQNWNVDANPVPGQDHVEYPTITQPPEWTFAHWGAAPLVPA